MIREVLSDYEKRKAILIKEKKELSNESKSISKAITELYIKQASKRHSSIHENHEKIVEGIGKLKIDTKQYIDNAQNILNQYNQILTSLEKAEHIHKYYAALQAKLLQTPKEEIKL